MVLETPAPSQPRTPLGAPWGGTREIARLRTAPRTITTTTPDTGAGRRKPRTPLGRSGLTSAPYSFVFTYFFPGHSTLPRSTVCPTT
jgi:hypothetical protein